MQAVPVGRVCQGDGVRAQPPTLSVDEARRIAIAAQGLAAPRPARRGAEPGLRHVTAVVERIGLLQIDSVNVLARAHYLPLFSRLGSYDQALLDRAAGLAPRRLVEYWAHEASLVPPSTHRLLRWRMARWRAEAWGSMRRVAQDHGDLVAAVLAEVAARGPVTAGEIERALAHDAPRAREHWGWNWSLVKQALEHLFWAGEVTSAGRTPQFERRYDLPERVLPHDALVARDVSDEEAFVELIRIAARACGVASEPSLRDYFRLRPADARPALRALVEAGDLLPVRVGGSARPAYLHRDARVPRRVHGCALLAPFDPLIWHRSRVEELFGFRYRVEIYVPAPKRVHGYYVLPFLWGDRLVARVDLKAERAARTLVVRGAWAEPDAPGDTCEALGAELAELARWLRLDRIRVEGRGDLAPGLAAGVSARRP